MLIEAKTSELQRSRSFYYYKQRLNIPNCVQLVMNYDKTNTRDGIIVTSAFDWLSQPLDADLFKDS